jgi:hypothetical protein
MTDIAKLADGLTEAQKLAMIHPNAGGSAYGWASINTLNALCAKALVRRIVGNGASYSPSTAIGWPFTDIGQALRRHLLDQEKKG